MIRKSVSSWVLLLMVGALAAFALLSQQPTLAQSGAAGDAVQGKYLVEAIGCQLCHGANLLGRAPSPTASPGAVVFPAIAGLPQFTSDADALKFFQTGTMPDGTKPRFPMLRLHFKASDAAGIVAYLRSVPKQ